MGVFLTHSVHYKLKLSQCDYEYELMKH